MKKNLIFCYFIFFLTSLYSNPYFLGKTFIHTDEYATVCISDNKIIFDDGEETGQLFQGKKFDYFSGENDYIILDCIVSGTYFLYLEKKDTASKFPYSSWEITFSKRVEETDYIASKLVPFKVVKASSFIVEKDKNGKDIRYLPENSNLFSLRSNPWAVTKDSDVTIELSTERWRNDEQNYYPISDIVVVNGFVYPGKEYLYEQNSRAKKIQISYNDISFEIELKDVGNFQTVHLPKSINPKDKNKIIIKILDYYEGTKYSDIVISGIYYMDALYEKSK